MATNDDVIFPEQEEIDDGQVSPAVAAARKRREQRLGEKTVSGRFVPGKAPVAGKKKTAVFNLIARGAPTAYEFDDSKPAMFLGTDPDESDIILMDQTLSGKQLAVMKVGSDYILADCGVNDKTIFNGIPCRQAVCATGGLCVININDETIIFDAGRTRTESASAATGLRFGLGVDEPLKPAGICQISFKMADREFALGVDPLVVGSCSICNPHISDTRMRPFHGMFHWTPDGVAVTRLSKGAVKVNGVEIGKTKVLSLTDRIEMGGANFTLNVTGDILAEGKAMFADHDWSHQDFRFSPLPQSVSKAFDLPGNCGSITVGRGATADIVLNDGGVSREHLQLIPSGKTVLVMDNYSANGTYVNDKMVTKARIRPGDCIEIGRSIFCLHYH